MLEGLLYLLFFLCIYFIPSAVASGKKGAAGIVALNILLGWTFLGWALALIWALAAEKELKENLDKGGEKMK